MAYGLILHFHCFIFYFFLFQYKADICASSYTQSWLYNFDDHALVSFYIHGSQNHTKFHLLHVWGKRE